MEYTANESWFENDLLTRMPQFILLYCLFFFITIVRKRLYTLLCLYTNKDYQKSLIKIW